MNLLIPDTTMIPEFCLEVTESKCDELINECGIVWFGSSRLKRLAQIVGKQDMYLLVLTDSFALSCKDYCMEPGTHIKLTDIVRIERPSFGVVMITLRHDYKLFSEGCLWYTSGNRQVKHSANKGYIPTNAGKLQTNKRSITWHDIDEL